MDLGGRGHIGLGKDRTARPDDGRHNFFAQGQMAVVDRHVRICRRQPPGKALAYAAA